MAAPTSGQESLKVSIVVPVHNAGPHLARSAPTLLGQTMSPQEYEVIYVDDGSTDDSPAQLARLQAEHPHVVVLTQPNSGWPGRPRNVGVDHARGVYVQFVDQDDRLGPEALERLWALASPRLPDIVLGKMGGGMSTPNLVFRRTVPWGDHGSIPAIDTLTAHKMFRRQFLRDHDIRFPEGYWRGEDLLFMAQAYARVTSMAVLADYVCYYWDRHEEGHNSRAPYELDGHFDRMRQIIAALRDGTTPGPLQDRLLRRLYRIELLSRLRPGQAPVPPDAGLRRRFDLSRAVALECFPPGVRDGMPGVQKLMATLLEQGDVDTFDEVNARVAALSPRIDRDATVAPDGTLRAHLQVGLRREGPDPLTVVSRDGRWLLDPELVGPALPGRELEVHDPTAAAHAEFQLFEPDAHVWWYPEGELEPDLREVSPGVFAAVAEGDLVIDPRTAAAGGPLEPGNYWVWVVSELLGVGRRRRLVMPSAPGAPRTRWMVGSARQVVRYDWSLDGGRVRLQVRDRRRWLTKNLQAGDPALFAGGAGRTIPVALAAAHQEGGNPVRVTLRSGEARGPLKATLTVDASGRRGLLELRARCALPDGDYDVGLGARGAVLGQARVRDGRILCVGPEGRLPSGRLGALVRSARLGPWAERLRRRLG